MRTKEQQAEYIKALDDVVAKLISIPADELLKMLDERAKTLDPVYAEFLAQHIEAMEYEKHGKTWEPLTEMPSEIKVVNGRYCREDIQNYFDRRYGRGVCTVEMNNGVPRGAIMEPNSALGAVYSGIWLSNGYVSAPEDVKVDIQSWWKYI